MKINDVRVTVAELLENVGRVRDWLESPKCHLPDRARVQALTKCTLACEKLGDLAELLDLQEVNP